MATQTDLMGLGMPGPLAQLLGNMPTTLAGIGTANTTGAIITSSMLELTTSSGQTAFILRSTAGISRLFFLFNSSSTTALIYPPIGGNINQAGTDTALSLVQNKAVILWHFSPLVYRSVLTA